MAYDSRSSARTEEGTAESLLNKWKQNPKNPRALYNKLKQKPDHFLDIYDLKVAEEDLKAQRMFSSDVGPEIVLCEYGYLRVKSAPEKPGGSYTLHFPDLRAQISLYVDLMSVAGMEDEEVGDALSNMETTFERIPPQIGDFNSFVLALDTVIRRIPLRFQDWYVPAVFGALHMCGLNVTIGDTSIDHRIIHCEQLSNDTRMRFMMDLEYESARDAWNRYRSDIVLPEPSLLPGKNTLGAMITLSDRTNNSVIRDWYGQFLSPNDELLREYSP